MIKKRIIFLSHSSKLTGAVQSLFNIVSNLDEEKYNSIIVCPREGPLTKLLSKEGISFNVLPMMKCITTVVWLDSFLKKTGLYNFIIQIQSQALKKLAKDFGCDVLVSNTVTIKHGAIVATELNLAHIWMVREHFMPGSPWRVSGKRAGEICETVASGADKIIFNSCLTKSSFVDCAENKETIIAINNKGMVIYPILKRFCFTQSSKTEKPKPGKHIKMAVMASVFPAKGQMEALKAFHMLSKQNTSCTLEFAGYLSDKRFTNELHKYIKDNGLYDKVRFLDFIEDVNTYLKTVDILIVPSLYEPFGMTAIEGMMSKTPVIVSRNAGVCELLADGEDALIIDPNSPREISLAIRKLIEDENLREGLAEAGIAKAKQLCKDKTYSKKFTQIIREIF